jgi:hypothetical protein
MNRKKEKEYGDMKARKSLDHWMVTAIMGVALAASVAGVSADDLTGASRFLCAPVQATLCIEDGECVVDLPWNVNIPQFIEVDLEAKRLATTEASGENRATPIEHLRRVDGNIVFHGFEMGRAFSWVIDEASGRVTAAVATDGIAVAIFGACAPLDGEEKEATQ